MGSSRRVSSLATALAGKGAHVVMACRNRDKTTAAVAAIRSLHPGAKLEHIPLDLADLSSVAAFADAYRRAQTRLDILCNNAGVMFAPVTIAVRPD